ncbi:MAG: hypothetical protein NUW22_06315 [Acidobacteria bacterium]|nr:hypothetical protein [Acidobacteriota bacterium]
MNRVAVWACIALAVAPAWGFAQDQEAGTPQRTGPVPRVIAAGYHQLFTGEEVFRGGFANLVFNPDGRWTGIVQGVAMRAHQPWQTRTWLILSGGGRVQGRHPRLAPWAQVMGSLIRSSDVYPSGLRTIDTFPALQVGIGMTAHFTDRVGGTVSLEALGPTVIFSAGVSYRFR